MNNNEYEQHFQYNYKYIGKTILTTIQKLLIINL